MLIKIFLIVLLVVGAFFFDMGISISVMDQSVAFSLWKFLILLFLVVFIYDVCCAIFRKLFAILCRKPDAVKGVGYLQEAFSGMLVKDHKVVIKALNKAKRHLGNIPFVSWLEGQLCLMNGDVFKAKSLFFNLSSKEKNTVLGAYSLAELSLQDKSERESVEAIKSILKVYPNSQSFINQIICLSIKNGNLEEAFQYLRKLSGENKKDIEAVIYFERWIRDKEASDISDLKKASKLASQIPEISISYVEELEKKGENKTARKVLLRSFEKFPSIKVFKKYISLCDDKVKAGEKLLKLAPQSWIPYYFLAKLCLEQDMVSDALEYISQAYELAQYDFIADELVKINAAHIEGEVLIDLSKARKVNFYWRCRKCGNHSSKWQSVCSCCISVASYDYVEEKEENLPVVI